MHIKVKVTTTPLNEISKYMSCCHCATGCQYGDILIKAIKHTLITVQFHFIPASPPLCHSFFLSPRPAHLGLSARSPHRLVLRVVGRPRPKALIGVEVHGVDFLPANLL